MTINKPSFSTREATNKARLVVRMLDGRPAVLKTLETPVTPFELVGFYDPSFRTVELFMANSDGTYYVRVGS